MVTILCKGCGTKRDESYFGNYKLKDGTIKKTKTCMRCKGRTISKESRLRTKLKAQKKMRERKIQLIEFMGGKCIICKQEYHPVCFDFHHINKESKIRSIASLLQVFGDENRLYDELKKCVMVCSNCHRIIHFGGN